MSKAEKTPRKRKSKAKASSDFTAEEIEVLINRGWVTPSTKPEKGFNSILNSNGNGFGHTHLQKTEDGEIHLTGSYATNVDVDWATYDMMNYKRCYKSFEDFINQNPYIDEERIS